MRWLYISPHLDDAILSCGGLIWEQSRAGARVEVWTVVCGVPQPGALSDLARLLHAQWGTVSAEETVALRRQEDRQACRRVAGEAVHFDVPDCIYRRSPQGELLYQDVFTPLHPAEVGLPDEIAAALAGRLKPDDALVSPLAIGGHVDHVMARQAAERLGRPLRYYADIPYLLQHPEALQEARRGMKAEIHPISAEGLRAWQDGVAAYASQIAMLFGSLETMRKALRGYWQGRHGVRLWRLA